MNNYIVSLALEDEIANGLADIAKSKGLEVDQFLSIFCESLLDPDCIEDDRLKDWVDSLHPGASSSILSWEARNDNPGNLVRVVTGIKKAREAFIDTIDRCFNEGEEEPETLEEVKRAKGELKKWVDASESIYKEYQEDTIADLGADALIGYDDCMEVAVRYSDTMELFMESGITTPAKEELDRRISKKFSSPVG